MKKGYVIAAILLVLASLVVSTLVYRSLPERIPTHWNVRGQVNGWGPKSTVFIFPGMLALMVVVFWGVLPAISPRYYEVESFRGTYDYVVFCVIALLAYMQGVTMWVTVQGPLDPGRGLIGGMCVFFILIGNVMGKVRRNFWLGVRTPWTLADERVWNATHRIAGWSFVLGGLAGLLAVLAGLHILVCVLFLVPPGMVPIIYSLVYYKRLERNGEL